MSGLHATSLLRTLGHPSLRKACFNLNVSKIKTHEVQQMFDQLLSCMEYFGCSSLSAPQIGLPYNFFAMETVFYEDFHDDKTEFERLFDLAVETGQETTSEASDKMELCEKYLTQLEFSLNNHVSYESELAKIEKLLSEQQALQQEIEQAQRQGRVSNSNTDWMEQLGQLDDGHIRRERIIVINPTWRPLSLAADELSLLNRFKQAAQAEGQQGQQQLLEEFLLKPMYSTLLFGLSNDGNKSSNFEQSISIPNIMCEKTRYNRIKVDFLDRESARKTCYLKSMDSRLFQHQCDHLQGVLMVDSVYENMWDKCLYIDEYVRQENEVYKPKIEQLLRELTVEDQNKLYEYYDPIHPPTSKKLVEILTKLIESSKQSKETLQQRAEDAMDESAAKNLLPEYVFAE